MGTSSTTRVRTSPRTSSRSTPTSRHRPARSCERNAKGQLVPVNETSGGDRSSCSARRQRRADRQGPRRAAHRPRDAECGHGRSRTQGGRSWNGPIYVATPQLLRTFGITTSEIDPNADILSSRPGLSGVSGLGLDYASVGNVRVPSDLYGRQRAVSRIPVIQEVGALPTGTSAPNTVITEHAMREFHIQASTTDWLVQGSQPFTRRPDQQRRAHRFDDAALGRGEERPADLVRRHRLGDDLRDRHRPRCARDVGGARPERDGERPPHAGGDRCVQLHAAHADRRDGRGARLPRCTPRERWAGTSP